MTEERDDGLDPTADAPGRSETQPESAGEDGGADLDTLLREFEGGDRSRKPVAEHGADPDWQDGKLGQPQAQNDQRLDQMMRWAQGVEHERLQQAKVSEFETLKQHVEEQISDLPQTSQVPEGFVQDALLAAYHTDPQLADAWDRLWSERDHVALERYRSAVKAQVRRLRSKVANLPDPKATADREAVAAAVRGHSAPSRSEDGDGIDAQKVAKMSDGEFEDFVKTLSR